MTALHVTLRQVEALVAQLWTQRQDPEALHAAEDALYVRVLQTIADGVADDPARLASAVLEARDVPGERWYS